MINAITGDIHCAYIQPLIPKAAQFYRLHTPTLLLYYILYLHIYVQKPGFTVTLPVAYKDPCTFLIMLQRVIDNEMSWCGCRFSHQQGIILCLWVCGQHCSTSVSNFYYKYIYKMYISQYCIPIPSIKAFFFTAINS